MKKKSFVAETVTIAIAILIANSGFMALSSGNRPGHIQHPDSRITDTSGTGIENPEAFDVMLWEDCNETVSKIIRTIYVRTNTLQRAQRKSIR
ncbi:MAG: hypothetical protein JW706_01715 [Opitutales bacterium]|nr:hypothetical protein [Opitutales bacterium]